MTGTDWVMLAFAFAFIGVLVFAADEIEGVEDDNDYNSERGVQEDKHSG